MSLNKFVNKFTCKNGYLDLEKKEFVPSEEQTNGGCGINYQVFEKTDPKYIKLMAILKKIYPNNLDDVLKMWTKCLQGGNGNKIFLHLGTGNNGKTTMMRLVGKTFGSYSIQSSDGLWVPSCRNSEDIRIVKLMDVQQPIRTENFDFDKRSYHIERNNYIAVKGRENNIYEIIMYETTFITEKQLVLEDPTKQLVNMNLNIEQYAEVFLFLLFEIFCGRL